MNGLLLLLGSAVFALALAAQDETEIEPLHNPRTSPDDVAAGAKTFRSHCAPCHGLHGEGGRGPNLRSGIFHHGGSDRDLLNHISDGIAGTEMPGIFYSPDRVWQVVAYVRSLHQGKSVGLRGDVSAGARLFQRSGCGNCHRVAGQGGRLGPDLTTIGATRSPEHLRESILDPNADVRERYWVASATDAAGKTYMGFLINEDTYTVQFIDFDEQLHSLSKSELSSYKVEKVSKMPSYKARLSATELDDLVAFLSSLRTMPDRVEGNSR